MGGDHIAGVDETLVDADGRLCVAGWETGL